MIHESQQTVAGRRKFSVKIRRNAQILQASDYSTPIYGRAKSGPGRLLSYLSTVVMRIVAQEVGRLSSSSPPWTLWCSDASYCLFA